ncbi:MAG TPA: DUF4129 domain-containing protein [Anaerolineaceae bacterium]|nr:DUF4129 domain-containing protein [Anaerolineaceae bacterium]
MISSWNRNLPVVATYFLACVMMVCFAATVVNLGARLYPLWQGEYYLAIALFVSLQVLVSRRYIEDTPIFSPDWFLQQAVEWVVILIFVRLSIYLTYGFGALQEDLSSLQESPLDVLLPSEVVVALAFAFVIHFLSSTLIEDLRLLEHDPDQLDMERKGYYIQNRETIRRSLITFVFIVGAVMLLMTAVIRVEISGNRFRVVDAPSQIWNLVVYFIAGLILLGLTRFSTLRTRWYLQEIPIRRDMALRWGIYSLVVLVGVAFIASFLPTRYSIGFLTLLGWIITGFYLLLSLFQLLILVPFFLLYQWLLSLFGQPVPRQAAPTLPPINPFLDQTHLASSPWMELLKTILLWGTIFAISFFSLYHYLKQRGELVAKLRNLPAFAWFATVARWLLRWFHGAKARVEEGVSLGIQRILHLRKEMAPRPTPGRSPRSISDPRDQVLSAYLDLIHENKGSPLERKTVQTPREYQKTLDHTIPEVEEEIQLLTDAFIEARYTPHPITEKTSNLARLSWKQISTAIQRFRESRKS